MPTIKPVILPAKPLKGGRHKIRIAISHRSETRYIPTDIIIDSEREFSGGSIVRRPDAAYNNTKLRNILNDMQKAIDELDYTTGLTCSELVYKIMHFNDVKNMTLQAVFEDYMQVSSAKDSTLARYVYIWTAIKRNLNADLKVNEITPGILSRLGKALIKSNLKNNSVRLYISLVRAVINHAKKYGYATYKIDPLIGLSMPKKTVRDSWLTVEQIKMIRDMELKQKRLSMCRDLFMLSYYLGGINFIDLMDINFKKNTKTIKYIRKKIEHKTDSSIEFVIPDEAREIIKKYAGSDGRLCNIHRNQKRISIGTMVYAMSQLSKKSGLSQLIFYSARKSFSQHAFNIGVSTAVIDYILGHKPQGGSSCIYSYIQVTPEMATEAVRKVLDNLNYKIPESGVI